MENEADMYHASANVSTLLLKLGEASRKFHSSLDEAATSARLAKLKTRSDDNPLLQLRRLPQRRWCALRSPTMSTL